jgi:SAM-dependent methyltransferase
MLKLNELIPTLLPPPARVLEVGCGDGGLARTLDEAGYEVLAIDPRAPRGAIFRQVTLEELEDAGPFDVAIADRALHHVNPLGPALAKLAGLAPLLVLEEFAWERIDPETQAWYETLHRELLAAGRAPEGPPNLDRWRLDHQDLHRSDLVLEAVAGRYEQRSFERQPYFYRWLELPEAEEVEQKAIDAGTIRPIGYRYVGATRAPLPGRGRGTRAGPSA